MGVKLVVFDVDGTLVDSQAHIVGAMMRAFETVGLACPSRADILGIVGLSLPQAMVRLEPDTALTGPLVDAYRNAFAGAAEHAASPLYPGARDVLEALAARDDVLMGVATGKSRRGLVRILGEHGLERFFVTTQVADDHPSKPAPSMLLSAMTDAGVQAHDTVIIGDTSFDMEMGRNAGTRRLGVSWGYHPRAALDAAEVIVDAYDGVLPALTRMWNET